NKKSESLKLIQQARNEAHRFAISFHHDQRSRHFPQTELNDIPGIGEKIAGKLLTHFGSVKKIAAATLAEVAEVIGTAKATAVRNFFNQKTEAHEDV
ncbi:MAG: helix-hairpin-helix domain-containing protein, partial [Haliscomenobacter sp.]